MCVAVGSRCLRGYCQLRFWRMTNYAGIVVSCCNFIAVALSRFIWTDFIMLNLVKISCGTYPHMQIREFASIDRRWWRQHAIRERKVLHKLSVKSCCKDCMMRFVPWTKKRLGTSLITRAISKLKKRTQVSMRFIFGGGIRIPENWWFFSKIVLSMVSLLFDAILLYLNSNSLSFLSIWFGFELKFATCGSVLFFLGLLNTNPLTADLCSSVHNHLYVANMFWLFLKFSVATIMKLL